MVYHTCPDCGANLDPGEQCDCWEEREEKDKMTDEYSEELLRFVGKLCPKFMEGKYEEKDYDPAVNAIYREYLGVVGVTSMKRLTADQLRHLNQLCRTAKEKRPPML